MIWQFEVTSDLICQAKMGFLYEEENFKAKISRKLVPAVHTRKCGIADDSIWKMWAIGILKDNIHKWDSPNIGSVYVNIVVHIFKIINLLPVTVKCLTSVVSLSDFYTGPLSNWSPVTASLPWNEISAARWTSKL